MRQANWIYLIPLLGALLSAPAMANEYDAHNAIKASNLSFEYALNTGNADALIGLYTTDAVLLPPTDETLTMPAAIREFWQAALNDGLHNVKLANFDTRIEGDTAYQAAIWSAETSAANGSTTHIGGNMVNIFSRQADGSWKPRLQSWN